MSRWKSMILVLGSVVVPMALGGCKSAAQQHLDAANTAYNAGDFRGAFRQAMIVADGTGGRISDQGAYTAGMAAFQLKDYNSAQIYLERVIDSPDRRLASDALAMMGSIHSSRGDFEKAADVLLRAAGLAEGQDQAFAYYYAALAQQRLGRWASARTNLLLARKYNTDPKLAPAISQQLEVTGFTIQIGAFSSRDNAMEAAEKLATETAGQRGVGAPWIAEARDSHGAILHQVQIGQFSTYQQALEVRNRLNRPSSFVAPLAGTGQNVSP